MLETTQSLEALKQAALESYREADAGGTTHYQAWAAIQAGRALIALKQQCRHGEYEKLQAEAGLNPTKARRFVGLANAPEMAQCAGIKDCREVIDRHEWRSISAIYVAHGLLSRAAAKPELDVEEIESLELCRFSGGYLFRASLGNDPLACATRYEVAMGTSNPAEARRMRDFGYRLLLEVKDKEGRPILSDRARKKWQAYKDKEAEAPEPEETPAEDMVERFRQMVRSYSLEEEFAELMPRES